MLFYKDHKVTLDSYKQVFKGYSADMLDEIRLAVLDDTNVLEYSAVCKNDSYKFSQLRLAIREYVPVDYLSVRYDGEVIFLVRRVFREGLPLEPLGMYLGISEPSNIGTDNIKHIIRAYLDGADISKVDFRRIGNSVVETYCNGLVKGYPMWLCTTMAVSISDELLKVLMRGMQLGLDIHPFLDGTWETDKIRMIFVYANKLDYGRLMELINSSFSLEKLTTILPLAVETDKYSILCAKDEFGYTIYDEYQMDALAKAIRKGIPLEPILDSNIPAVKMELYVSETKASIGTSGKLPKKHRLK